MWESPRCSTGWWAKRSPLCPESLKPPVPTVERLRGRGPAGVLGYTGLNQGQKLSGGLHGQNPSPARWIGVDACLLVVEAGTQLSKADEELIRRFRGGKIPAVLAINKIDLLEDKSPIMEQIAQYAGLYEFQAVVPVSAKDGKWHGRAFRGAEEALPARRASVPGGHAGPTSQSGLSPRRLSGEKVLRLLDKEVPHGVAAVTERMKDRDGILDIDVTIYCEKPGHKGILIGKGGAMLKRIGTAAPPGHGALFRLQGEPAAVGQGEGGLAPASGNPAKPGIFREGFGAVIPH